MRWIIKDTESGDYVTAIQRSPMSPTWSRHGEPKVFASSDDARAFCRMAGLTSGAIRLEGTINSGYQRFLAVESETL